MAKPYHLLPFVSRVMGIPFGWRLCAEDVQQVWAVDLVREHGYASTMMVEGLGALRVEATEQAIGGQRFWFRCPRCNSRRAWLVAAGGQASCRVCSRLAYKSQCLSELNRRNRRAEAIYERINVECGPLYRAQGRKPYGMRWRTYWRLYEQAQATDPWPSVMRGRYRHGRGLRNRSRERPSPELGGAT